MPPEAAGVDAAVAAAAREHSGRLIALLAHRFGDLDLADEVVQEAFVEAMTAWRTELPDNPAAWLMTVARNRAIDRLRREAAARRRLLAAAHEHQGEHGAHRIRARVELGGHRERDARHADLPLGPHDPLRQRRLGQQVGGGDLGGGQPADEPQGERHLGVAIERRMAAQQHQPQPFVGHGSVVDDHRIALLGIVARRIGRAAQPGIRRQQLNEGYLARGAVPGGAVLRADLAEEAIRLARVLARQLPDDAEVQGLLALMLLQQARSAARLDELGELVLLDQQDRTRWDGARIDEGTAVLAAALRRMRPGPWQVQALIAARHATARTADDTDWPGIAGLYAQLAAMTGSPVVTLNRAVAVAMADGARAGLSVLDGVHGLDRYHLAHATRGELLLRLGAGASGAERIAAVAAFERALPLTANPAERRHLERRLALARSRALAEAGAGAGDEAGAPAEPRDPAAP